MAQSQASAGHLLWALVPLASLILAMGLTILPYGFVGGAVATPAFALIPLYFWAVHRPQLLPATLVFLLGLAQDLVTGGPVGLWGVVFLVTLSLTLSQRARLWGLRLRVSTLAFALVALAGLIGGWFCASVFESRFVDIRPMVYQAGVTALVFPPLAFGLMVLEREIARTLR